MTLSPALLDGRYRLRDPLGNGGMGRVWLARDEVLHRDVAIKEVDLPADLSAAEREELRVRTLREARTAARLSHPNVVQIYDVLGFDDRPWIVMEYIKSRSLQQILLTDGAVGVQRTAEIGLAVMRALAAAHSAGVLHRDVKPGNVLIADDGRVVLTDFGLATFEGGESSVTRPGLVWGSPEYVAPERAKHGDSSVEADLWSLGATLFAAVEGASPYARPTAMASLTALATEKPPVPRHAGPLKPVITGLLRKDPRARMRLSEVERVLLRVAGHDTGPRRLPRQRPAEIAAPVDTARATAAAPGPSYLLPEPPADVTGPAQRTRSGRRGPGRRAWLAISAVVLVVVGIAGTALLLDDRRSGQAARPPGNATPSSGTPRAPGDVVRESSPMPGDYGLTAGWTYYQEDHRFRMAAPLGWLIERDGTITRLREAGGPKVLSVNRWPAPAGGATAAVQAKDRAWASATDGAPDGYELIAIQPIDYFDGGVEWEYAYRDPSIGSMRTVSRWFVDGPNCFAIAVSLPGYDLAARNAYFDLLIGSFRPLT